MTTRPSLLARLKDWSQQTAWHEFDHDYAPLLRNVLQGLSVRESAKAAGTSVAAVYMAKSRIARLARREAERVQGA